MAVKWLGCLPSTPSIRVRIPLKPKVLFCKLFEKNENKQKEAGYGPIFIKKTKSTI